MKTKTLIKNWLTGLKHGSDLRSIPRICRGLAEAATLDTMPLMPVRQLIPIAVHAESRFKPRINFRRPQLDSLTDFARIERSLRKNLRRPS